MKKKNSQSVLEYTLVLAVIIVAIILASGKIKDTVKAGYDNTTEAMKKGTENFPKFLGS